MVANTLVAGMIALAVALITGIFLLEIQWDESSSSFWSDYGKCVGGCVTPVLFPALPLALSSQECILPLSAVSLKVNGLVHVRD